MAIFPDSRFAIGTDASVLCHIIAAVCTGSGAETDNDTTLGNSVHIAGNLTGTGQHPHYVEGFLRYDSTSKVQTYTQTYPADPNNTNKTVIHKILDSKFAMDFSVMQKGKKLSTHQVCIKS